MSEVCQIFELSLILLQSRYGLLHYAYLIRRTGPVIFLYHYPI